MKLVIAVALTLVALQSKAEPEEIGVGRLIDRVIAGEDFAGDELVVTGVVLDGGSSGSGLINLATPETYRSLTHDNFVSVYESSVVLPKGNAARLRVRIEESSGHRLGGKDWVIISAVFLECQSCSQ